MTWTSANIAREPSPSDESLVRSAQTGDRAAYGQLYQRFGRMVHGVLLARVPRAAAEDLAQDVFLQALPKLLTLRDPSRFGPWLAAIARNRAIDFHRRTKAEDPIEEDPAAGESAATVIHAAGDTEDSVALLSMVRELPETYRETLILRFVEGLTGPEIAERTGLKHGSVRVNLHRGLQLLREKWERKSAQ